MMDIHTYKELTEYAVQLGEAMKNAIVQRHIDAGQKATGKTSRSLRIEPTIDGFQFVGWKYAGSYEEGRRPNKSKSGKIVPIEALIEWAKAKGIQFKDDRQARSFAFCLARKIAREGTERYKLAQAGQQPDIFRTPIADMKKQLTKAVSGYWQYAVMQELYRTDINRK